MAKDSYHPVEHMKKMLDKQSKNFSYLAGYKKPSNNLVFEDRRINISQMMKTPFKNSSITKNMKSKKGFFKTEVSYHEELDSPKLDINAANNDLNRSIQLFEPNSPFRSQSKQRRRTVHPNARNVLKNNKAVRKYSRLSRKSMRKQDAERLKQLNDLSLFHDPYQNTHNKSVTTTSANKGKE